MSKVYPKIISSSVLYLNSLNFQVAHLYCLYFYRHSNGRHFSSLKNLEEKEEKTASSSLNLRSAEYNYKDSIFYKDEL